MSRKALLISGVALLAAAGARAQPADPIGELLAPDAAQPQAQAAPVQTVRSPLSTNDIALVRQALESARRGDVNGAHSAIAAISDPVARKTALWALVDSNGPSLGFAEVDQARRQLADWPRPTKRQNAAEALIETSGLSPAQIVRWFDDNDPQTAQGALALASAYRMLGQNDKAASLVKYWWRNKSFDVDAQRTMLTRFGDVLTQDDYVRRADILLYGNQMAAARDLIPLLPPDQQQAALARISLREGAANGNELAQALPNGLATSPGVAFERAAYLRRKGLTELASALLPYFPREAVTADQADRIWDERHQLMLASLKAGDAKAAYAAADAGITSGGSDAAEAEFSAGWLALTKLKNPQLATEHFAALDRVATSPITRARAAYWKGRAAEARGDAAAAHASYEIGAQFNTTFYGQLCGEKLGQPLVLAKDPQLTPADRARFEANDAVQGARLLHDLGQSQLYRVFVLSLSEVLPSASDEALLVDMVRGYGEQDLSMKVARNAATRGFVLPDRAYPMRLPPSSPGQAETALTLSITRQESNFDPSMRSGVGARGMMQLMPATASIVARKIGVSYSPSMLDEPDYNMRLGSSFLGELVDRFSGSYIMAVAAYNAGPGRPTQWVNFCGDPRGASTDPVDYIECIPFSETRNYVMRVMETMEVYRAKMHGGTTPLTLSSDLQRGAYSYPAPAAQVSASATLSSTGS